MSITDPLKSASGLLAAGRKIETSHMRVIAENMANYKSTAATPGGSPYSRKTAVFSPVLPDSDRDPVGRIVRDDSDFRQQSDPTSIIADAKGNVKLPNIELTVESANLQTMIRSYELNLNASATIDKVTQQTLDLLR